MKIRDEQIEPMSETLGLDFRARLGGALRKLPAFDAGQLEGVIDYCLPRAKRYGLASEREIATFTLAMAARRGGFHESEPPEAESILRDRRVASGERLSRLIEWAGGDAGEFLAMGEPFSDEPAAGPVARAEEPSNDTALRIRLADEADGGIEGEEYCVELPSGVPARGFLDWDGAARIEGVDGSECQVSFPNLDRDVWERLS